MLVKELPQLMLVKELLQLMLVKELLQLMLVKELSVIQNGGVPSTVIPQSSDLVHRSCAGYVTPAQRVVTERQL